MRTALRPVVLLAILAFLACVRRDSSDRPGWLHLDVRYELPLPEASSVRGGVIDDSGRLAVWGGHSMWVFHVRFGDHLAPTEIAMPESEILAVRFDERGAVALLVTPEGAVTLSRILPDSSRISRWILPLKPEVACACQGRWYIGGRDQNGFFRVYRLLSAERYLLVGSATHAAVAVTPYFLSCLGSDITVTEVLPPFETRALSPESALPAVRPDLDSTGFGTVGAPAWVSSPLFTLRRQFLQVLSELRSDRRLLILYDETGRELRRRALDAPFGILATNDSLQVLLGTRRLKQTEVIIYSWRWDGQ